MELQKGQLRLAHRESGDKLLTGLLLGYLPQSSPTPKLAFTVWETLGFV